MRVVCFLFFAHLIFFNNPNDHRFFSFKTHTIISPSLFLSHDPPAVLAPSSWCECELGEWSSGTEKSESANAASSLPVDRASAAALRRASLRAAAAAAAAAASRAEAGEGVARRVAIRGAARRAARLR